MEWSFSDEKKLKRIRLFKIHRYFARIFTEMKAVHAIKAVYGTQPTCFLTEIFGLSLWFMIFLAASISNYIFLYFR